MTTRSAFPIGVGALLLAGTTAPAAVTFTNIDSSPTNFYGLPCINNAGQVAFERTNGVNFSSGIFRGTGGPLTTIAASGSGGLDSMVTHPSINGSGVVAFKAYQTSGNQGVYKGSGGALTLIDTIGASFAESSNADVSINTAGTVAFRKFTTGTASGIYTGSGGAVTPVVTSGAIYNGFGTLQMNDSGAIAFYGNSATNGVYSSVGAPYAATATQDMVSMNESGRALFHVGGGGSDTLYSSLPGGPAAPLIDDSGPFSGFTAGSINNLNQYAVLASLDNTAIGIFTGPNPVADKVIQTGDALFGSTVQQLGLWDEALNDQGDIAFSYFLANGTFGIAVAHVPAPAGLGLLGAAGVLAARRRRVHQSVAIFSPTG